MISVVIPSVNRSSLYDRTLPSLLSLINDYNVEVIVVFDGDTTNDPRRLDLVGNSIKVYSSQGRGGMAARLLGAQHANFEKVLFLDDDDELVFFDCSVNLDRLRSSSFLLLRVNAIWPDNQFITWYISFFARRSTSFSQYYVPSTFSGMLIDRHYLLDEIEYLRFSLTFQDVLIFNHLFQKGLSPSLGAGTVNFYQSIDETRNSQNIEIRVKQLSKIYRENLVNRRQMEVILTSLFFAKLRQIFFKRRFGDIFFILKYFYLNVGSFCLMKAFFRLMVEVPLLFSFYVSGWRRDKFCA